MGITRVRPLLGGYFGWRDLGLPLVDFDFSSVPGPQPVTVQIAKAPGV